MVRKLFWLLCATSTLAFADSTTYTPLYTTDPDKIAAKEEKVVSSTGYDSQGHTITLYQTFTAEKYFDLYKAFDIGIRHHTYWMVRAAIGKLNNLKKTIDVSDSIVVLCDNIRSAAFSKKLGYIAGGITAAAAILPWLPEYGMRTNRLVDCATRESSRVEVHPEFRVAEKVCMSAFILGIGAVIWWASKTMFNSTVEESFDVLQLLLTSRACVISHRATVERALVDVLPLLSGTAREAVGKYLATNKI